MRQRNYEDFVGFRFGNTHSSELGLKVVSSSNRYEKNLLPSPTDYSSDIAGSNGQYYFGSVFKNRELSVDVAFNDIDEPTWRKIAQLFSTDKLQDLVFDELPFKTYKAKLKNKPEFKFICFTDKRTGQRVYKGEGKISFICYYPYAFGFDKYLTRAADGYYTPHMEVPKDISIQSAYSNNKKKPQRTYLQTEHMNVEGNMNTPWKTGYPTLEQVQQGELYFNSPEGKKLIVDTRAYWQNVPEWQCAAQLLVSPTLDQDGDLIFMPQYSKINYYNMDTGLNSENGLIGSRILVYNPGDVPVDFELKLGNLSSKLRRNLDKYTFRISRYNVQRLTIEQAVDWTGLTTYNKADNVPYKYGEKYFKIIEPNPDNIPIAVQSLLSADNWNFNPYFRNLGCAHPKHTYIVEPIPREKLSHFIRLFYWQSENCEHTDIFEKGIEMANRYDELYKLCITDDEKYELYWDTLHKIFEDYEDFSLTDYIYNPPEFFYKNDLNYGEFEFNKYNFPSYYTYDYFDINNDNFDKIEGGEINNLLTPLDDARRTYTLPLFLNSDKHMLYNINKNEDRYNFNLTKFIHNENIEQGHWFKIPCGWSLIDISPVLDADKWGGKRWLDARPFEWGNTNNTYRTWYDNVYQYAAIDYLSENITETGIVVGNSLLQASGSDKSISPSTVEPSILKNYFSSLTLDELENYMQFNRWYNYDNIDIYETQDISSQTNKNKADWAEIGFLRTLANYWRVNRLSRAAKPIGDVNDWFYYANNYIWGNFPPLYWGYADLLNHAEIKYVPLFY